MVHFLPGNFFNIESVARSVQLELFKTSFPVFSEMVIVSDDKFPRSDGLHQDLANELFGRQLGKLLGERDAHQVLDPLVFEEVRLFLEGVEDFEALVVRVQHQPGMRPKRNHDCFPEVPRGDFSQPRKNLLVAEVHAVEGTTGDHGVLQGSKVIDSVIYFHAIMDPKNFTDRQSGFTSSISSASSRRKGPIRVLHRSVRYAPTPSRSPKSRAMLRI